jgi:hypothetical protein
MIIYSYSGSFQKRSTLPQRKFLLWSISETVLGCPKGGGGGGGGVGGGGGGGGGGGVLTANFLCGRG